MRVGLRSFLDNLLASPNPVFDHRVDAHPMLFRGQFDPGRVPEWQGRQADWTIWDSDTLRTDAVRKSVIVFACLSYLADAVAEAVLTVESLDADDGWEVATARAALALQSVIRRPNPFMEDAEFHSLLIFQMGVTGYAVVEKVRTRQGTPVELWPLRSDWLRKRQDGSYDYRPDGAISARSIPADDLIFIPWRHDDRMVRHGISPVQVAAREVGIDSALTDFLKTFLDAGGIPPFVMTYPDPILDTALIEKIQLDWEQKYGGSKAWGKIPVLHGGYALQPIGSDINEMAWPDLRGLTELKICQALRVPADLVQARESLHGNSLTTTEAEGAMTQLQRYGAEPLRSRLASALGRGLLPDFGLDHLAHRLVFDITGILALQEDEDKRHTRIRADWDSGLLMLDEARTAIARPELPANQGQVFKVSFSTILTPASGLVLPEPSPPKRQRTYIDLKALSPRQLEFRARADTRIRRDRQRLIQQGARHIGKFLRDQGRRLSEELAKSQPIAVKDLQAIDWAVEEEALLKILNALWSANGEAAYEATAALTGTETIWEINNPTITSLLRELALRVRGITEETRTQVQDIVTQGLMDGKPVSEIAEELGAHIEQTYKGRAMTIARTESMYSYGRASVLAYTETGVVEQVELMDNAAHNSDPSPVDGLTCAQRDGLVVDLAAASTHIEAEHPNGSLLVLPVLATPPGDE